MTVCACGQPMRIGEVWCHACYMFWNSWWLRCVKDSCDCEACIARRHDQPLVDELEGRVINLNFKRD